MLVLRAELIFFAQKDVVFPKTLQKCMKMPKMLMNISKSSKLIFSASSLFSIAKIRSKGKAWAKPNDHGLVLTARYSLANQLPFIALAS